MLESEHQFVTALSVESGTGVLQMIQKHIRGWKIGLGAYNLPTNAKSLVGSGISHGQPVRKPLSTTHGDGGSI